MSFSDHNYGGDTLISSGEEGVIHILHKFLNEVGAFRMGHMRVDSPHYCDQKEFIKALEKLIQVLQTNLQKMSSELTYPSLPNQSSDDDEATIPDVDPDLIQVHADNDEIQRRISAFMERKQREVDDINNREFCSSFGSQESEDSCARTDAVYIPSEGKTSHVKVSRVVNRFGPQISGDYISPCSPRTRGSKMATDKHGADMEERVRNMEEHLRINQGSVSQEKTKRSQSELFSRIKKLEERILELESISPEYSALLTSPNKQSRKDGLETSIHMARCQEMPLTEINDMIANLRQQLKQKSSRVT